MSSRLSRSFAALALLGALGIAPVVDARPPHGGSHHGRVPGGLVARHAERLGLDDETLATIQRVVDESGVRQQSLYDEIRVAHEAMRALLSVPTPDADAVMAQADVIGALETESHQNRLRTIIEIRSHLTPEQREELIRIREEKFAHRRRGPLGRCSGDLHALCSSREPGRAALQCLHERWDDLSEPCRAAFSFEATPKGPR